MQSYYLYLERVGGCSALVAIPSLRFTQAVGHALIFQLHDTFIEKLDVGLEH